MRLRVPAPPPSFVESTLPTRVREPTTSVASYVGAATPLADAFLAAAGRRAAGVEIERFGLEAALRRMLVQAAARGLVGVDAGAYARGIGSTWARVVAVRADLSEASAASGEDALVRIVATHPEIAPWVLTRPHAFRSAFAAAMGRIGARHRTALRLRHVDGLPLRRVADLLGVHPRRVARLLVRARHDLLRCVRRIMAC